MGTDIENEDRGGLGDNPSRRLVLERWDPEDPVFWERFGRRIARRNLVASVFALLVSFSVNTLAALVSVRLASVGFSFDSGSLFLLTALPGLVGATGRLAYTYMPALFGGRTWTLLSTAFMVVPLSGIGFSVQDPSTPFWALCLWFALLGLSLSNFSSSMANIGYFYPVARKGTANGINAGIGNLGVAVAYFVTPIVVGTSLGFGPGFASPGGSSMFLQNACFVWIAPIALSLALTAALMDDLPLPRQSPKQLASIFGIKHTWFLTIIYTCGFGSFIGYSMAFALVVGIVFPDAKADYAMFVGPLVGAAIRPVGGWLSDKVDSGSRVTLASLVAMLVSTMAVVFGVEQGNFTLFFSAFVVLFLATGFVNGASFRMIPHIFPDRLQASQVTGFASAIAAYGAFLVPLLFRADFQVAFAVLVVFTGATAALTWVVYARKGSAHKC